MTLFTAVTGPATSTLSSYHLIILGWICLVFCLMGMLLIMVFSEYKFPADSGRQFLNKYGTEFYIPLKKNNSFGQHVYSKGLMLDPKWDRSNHGGHLPEESGIYFFTLRELCDGKILENPEFEKIAKVRILPEGEVCKLAIGFWTNRIFVTQIMSLPEFFEAIYEKDPEIIEKFVCQNFNHIRHVPMELQTEGMMRGWVPGSVIQNDFFRFINPAFQTLKMCRQAVGSSAYNYPYIRKDLRVRKNIKKFIKTNEAIAFLTLEDIQEFDEDMISNVIRIAESSFNTVFDRKTKDFICRKILKGFPQNAKICKEIVRLWGNSLQFVEDEYQTVDMCKEALNQNPSNYKHICSRLRTRANNKEFVRYSPLCVLFVPGIYGSGTMLPTDAAVESTTESATYNSESESDSEQKSEFTEEDDDSTSASGVAEEIDDSVEVVSEVSESDTTHDKGPVKTAEPTKPFDETDNFDEELVLIAIQELKHRTNRMLSEGHFPEELKRRIRLGVCKIILEQIRQTPSICDQLIRWEGMSLEFMNEDLVDEDLCGAAVRDNGLALMHVPFQFQSNIVITDAISQNIRAFRYVVRKTIELCELVKEIKKAMQ